MAAKRQPAGSRHAKHTSRASMAPIHGRLLRTDSYFYGDLIDTLYHDWVAIVSSLVLAWPRGMNRNVGTRLRVG